MTSNYKAQLFCSDAYSIVLYYLQIHIHMVFQWYITNYKVHYKYKYIWYYIIVLKNTHTYGIILYQVSYYLLVVHISVYARILVC